MQCGVAALAMVCRYFGKAYSMSFLDSLCHPTTEGVSLLGISDAARRLGLDNVSARVGIAELPKCPLPAILHWNQNHFTVLYKISKNGKRY